MEKDKVLEIVDRKLEYVLNLKKEKRKRWEEDRLNILRDKLDKNLKDGKIMSWLGMGLGKYFVFSGCVDSGREAKELISDLRYQIFPLVYAEKIKIIKEKIDVQFKDQFRTTGQLRKVDIDFYHTCANYLKKDGKFDLDLLSKVFGETFYPGGKNIYKSAVERVLKHLIFLDQKSIAQILHERAKEDKCPSIYDNFIRLCEEYEKGYNFKSGAVKNRKLKKHSLTKLINKKNKKLHLGVCCEISILAKAGRIDAYELMLDYFSIFLRPEVEESKQGIKRRKLKKDVTKLVKLFLLKLREVSE